MPVKIIILFVLLQAADKCQHNSAGNTSGDTTSEVTPGRILVEKCTDLIKIQQLDTVIFQFYEVPGRGYSWIPVSPETPSIHLVPAGTKRTLLTDKDGAPEKVEFYYKAGEKGTAILKFIYVRPWEKNKPAADSCITKILIN